MTIRLLYVDDDIALGRLVQRRLTRVGFVVELAHDGWSGLMALAKGGIDAVALDHAMPGQDGLETLAAIRKMPDAPPVVFVTGNEESRLAVAAMKAGASDYVIKDVEGRFIQEMKAAVEQALTERAAQRAGRPVDLGATDEQSLLLREMNHRIGNNLQLIASLLHMQAGASGNAETRQALTGASNRVAAVAQVHRRLYMQDDVGRVALAPYLDSLADDLRRAQQESREELSVRADAIDIDPERALAIGVIVTELVINARKYAYPGGDGPIRVVLMRCDEGARLVVEDDGVGKAAPRDGASTGLGRRIIDAMAAKLGSHIVYDPAHAGTRAIMTFALPGGALPGGAAP